MFTDSPTIFTLPFATFYMYNSKFPIPEVPDIYPLYLDNCYYIPSISTFRFSSFSTMYIFQSRDVQVNCELIRLN